MRLIDPFGRTINYLRLSVTDRCNLRCHYCMPGSGVTKVSHHEILRYEELLMIAQAAVSIGVEKVRITGGEPLVRRGITGFLAQLSQIPGLRHLALTTNGLLLGEMAHDLKRSGVQRLNISLDSLKPEIFDRITRGGDLGRVLNGISQAGDAGIPIKLNMVVMQGTNDNELVDFAALTLERPISVRFIEYMPTLKEPGWEQLILPGEEILGRISERFAFTELDRGPYSGPSRDFRINGATGTFGIITPVSGHFCSNCNRIRVTSSGMAKGCLFSESTIDLKPFVRSGDMQGLTGALKMVVCTKPEQHGMTEQSCSHEPFVMARIGG
jgi:cyclic pyranopterin phosphate synthase